MKSVNIHEAKTHLSRLVDEVVAGEEIVIAKAGKPMARLVAVAGVGRPRVLGRLAGRVTEARDCWRPDPEVEALFYREAIEPPPVRRVSEREVHHPRRKR